jgi:hypothetical protein
MVKRLFHLKNYDKSNKYWRKNKMKKILALKELREIIEREELAVSQYADDTFNCCVIGHLLKTGGVSHEQLSEIDNGKYDPMSYSIGRTMSAAREDDIDDNFVKEALESLGFDLLEDEVILTRLQSANDDSEGNRTSVLNALDDLIDELEGDAE